MGQFVQLYLMQELELHVDKIGDWQALPYVAVEIAVRCDRVGAQEGVCQIVARIDSHDWPRG